MKHKRQFFFPVSGRNTKPKNDNKYFRRGFSLFIVVLLISQLVVVSLLPPKQASAVASGDGLAIWGRLSSTTPQTRSFTDATDSFSATAATVAGATGVTFTMRTSPIKQEAVAGYVTSGGVLQIMCYNGTSWTNEWTATVGGNGSLRRFDIAYENETGDVMVLYSANAAPNNELAYRTKPAGSACGSANWASAATMSSTHTTGIVHGVRLAWDRRPTSNLITAIWVDANSDLSSLVWSGTAWGNEPTGALDNSLEVITASHDAINFDVEYESLSGDVMIVWGNSAGTEGVNGVRYATCTGGTSACTWSAVQTPPAWSDAAYTLDISANPATDEMVFASSGSSGVEWHLQVGRWSGTTWNNTANYDTTTRSVIVGSKPITTGWLISGATTRSIIVYADNTNLTFLGWIVGNGNAFTTQADFDPTPDFASPQRQNDIHMDPVNTDRLMFTVSDNNSDLFAKRLVMTSVPGFTWTNSDGSAALEASLSSVPNGPHAYAYWQHSTFEQSAYRWYSNVDSVDPGGFLAANNTKASTSTPNPVRLRMLLHIGETGLTSNDRAFKLQVAEKSGTCDTAFVGETYADVTDNSGDVRFYNNATPADGANANTTANDPDHSSHTEVAQTYEELNTFTSRILTPSGQDALWDFAIDETNAFGSYCFRIVNSDDTVINTYTQIPEATFCGRPQTEHFMRHGNFFCDETEKSFYWSL